MDNERFCIVPFPEYRYAKLYLENTTDYNNHLFDNILYYIGKYYYRIPNCSINEVCRSIKKDINHKWKLNKIRKIKQGKHVSITQIKTIRYSFYTTKNKRSYILIPFHITSILVYIMSLFNSINEREESDYDLIQLKRRVEELSIYMSTYKFHADEFIEQYNDIIDTLSDVELITKYNYLEGQFTDNYSVIKLDYEEIDWNNIDNYKIQ